MSQSYFKVNPFLTPVSMVPSDSGWPLEKGPMEHLKTSFFYPSMTSISY
jgi:hypothetical protein